MSETSASANDDEQVIVAFLLAREAQGSAIVGQYIERHPHLAQRFHEILSQGLAVDESRPSAEPPIPERLGEFRIVRRLRRGGMGEIYLAEQAPLGRRVAIKIVRQGRTSAQARRRFEVEQSVLARLHQTHIVPIHTAGEQDGITYFAMPYVDGASLRDVIRAARGRSGDDCRELPGLSELAVVAAGTDEREIGANRVHTSPTRQRGSDASSGNPSLARRASVRPSQEAQPVASREYLHSVAQMMMEAAGALQHAHDKGILHRDIKPDNLMLDRSGHCWLIDFGLAGLLQSSQGPRAAPPAEDPLLSLLTSETEVGTQFYMAPEQFDGRADHRTDIWGLGVTLYELLALHRPFDGATKAEIRERIVSHRWVVSPGKFKDARRDLMSICAKAAAVDPAKRYQSAGELRDDLQCWLDHRPITARKLNVAQSTALWTRRKPALAAAISCIAVVIVGLLATVAGWQFEVAARSRREVMLLELERLRRGDHREGWTIEAFNSIREIAEIDADGELRDQCAATLAGMDAVLRLRLQDFDASSVAIDASGRQVLAGGSEASGAVLWDCETRQRSLSQQPGVGPVAFDANDVPLALIAPKSDPGSLWLWDVRSQTRRARFEFPAGCTGPPGAMALSSDAQLCAAVLRGSDADAHSIIVWRTGTASPAISPIIAQATSLAFSPDGKLLASGNETGQVEIYSLASGDRATGFSMGHTPIRSLAFSRSRRVRAAVSTPSEMSWLVAAGNDGGELEIWDLETGLQVSRCRGSEWSVDGLAFSPDGATLASTGRFFVRLWDVATGGPLFKAGASNTVTGLCYSSDGRQLAFSAVDAYGSPGGLGVLELDPGRGLLSLRGLSTRIAKVQFSPDGRWLAGLSHNWQVALWRLPRGELLRVIDVPPGMMADNSALAFDAAGERFAFAADGTAVMWQLDPFDELARWRLEGLGVQENLAFHNPGRLLFARVETDGGDRPTTNAPAGQSPLICTVRDLLGPNPTRPVVCLHDFNLFVERIKMPHHGRFFVVVGIGEFDAGRPQIAVFDALTGERQWTAKRYTDQHARGFFLDPAGATLAYLPANGSCYSVLAMPDGAARQAWVDGFGPLGIRPNRVHWMVDDARGVRLTDVTRAKELVTLGIDQGRSITEAPFSHDGRYAAWGNRDGTVTIADLEEIRRRLNSLGMGW